MQTEHTSGARDPRVPLFGTWRRAYLAVALIFAVQVAFFYFVGRYFS